MFILIFYLLDKKMGIKVNKFLQATLLFLYSIFYFKYRLYPPIPFSVRAIYATMTLIGSVKSRGQERRKRAASQMTMRVRSTTSVVATIMKAQRNSSAA